MTNDATLRAREEPFLKVLRALVETYNAFSLNDQRICRELGLTQSQFDVVATLGNTPGMSCGEISGRTLVTKGTLTGVLDRLEARGLVVRIPSPTDRRSQLIRLTDAGDRLFRKAFPAMVSQLKPRFEDALSPAEMGSLRDLLLRLKSSFEAEPTPARASTKGRK